MHDDPGQPRFAGSEQALTLFGHDLESPPIYVADRGSRPLDNARLICFWRGIAKPVAEPPKALGYRPRICDVPDHRFGRYVEWLAGSAL